MVSASPAARRQSLSASSSLMPVLWAIHGKIFGAFIRVLLNNWQRQTLQAVNRDLVSQGFVAAQHHYNECPSKKLGLFFKFLGKPLAEVPVMISNGIPMESLFAFPAELTPESVVGRAIPATSPIFDPMTA
ncbi:MAG TPA: hypothetical protein PKL18_06840 [Accumulibacter sp.]|nr:hypothetical protein [Accumulibacter sp.]